MMRKVTRNDVARRAGVSPAVVSYVINDSNYVSLEKREAVLKAIKELEYTPNMFAKGLKTNRSNQVALVGDSLQGELFGALSTILFDRGFYSSLFYSQIDDAFIRRIIDGRFDAVFMTSNSFSSAQLNSIVESGIPMVLYKSRNYTGLDERIVTIVPDFYDSMKKAVDYLVLKGHQRIAYIPPLKYKTAGIHGDDFRAMAYVETLQAHGITANPEFFCTDTKTVECIFDDIFRMLSNASESTRPTAFIVGDDHLAAQVMQYLKKFNLKVPEDAAIVGWGNIPSSQITTPQLTTIECNIEMFALKVVDALVALVGGAHPADEFCDVKLIIRESS